jgi:glyoxylase-like metal-dependent hydrolase (beta-lactamase superfamily II)
MMNYFLVGILFVFATFSVQAFELIVEQVVDDTYAIVGHIGPRTAENQALNNTLGFVVTAEGVVLVSSGATPAGAALIEKAVASVTDQPIQHVINIGAQDHHWLGNSYFAAKGIPITALQKTVDSQKKHVEAQLGRLVAQIGEAAKTVSPTYANRVIDRDHDDFTIGGVAFTLLWPGGGHFEGDAVLWMPALKTVFTGDFVFHDRMLGIHATTPFAQWRESFVEIAKLKPTYVIPGHGYAGDFAKSTRDTGHYLAWLRRNVKEALADWRELGETIEQLSDAPQFKHLQFFDRWHKRNIHQVYMQLEAVQ